MNLRLTEARAWQALTEHFPELRERHLQDLFAADPERARRHALEIGPLYADFSKQPVTTTTLELFARLADEMDLSGAREQLFNGATVNVSENRAARHTALRAADADEAVQPETLTTIRHELARMTELHRRLTTGQLTGFTGQALTRVINIGIGGSDLGPRLLTEAVTGDQAGPEVRFVANLDPADLERTLTDCTPATTLFIISSKSFGTLETRSNFSAARRWLQAAGCREADLRRHFIAATANSDAAIAAGIDADNIYRFWDWVGGRYSVWSAAALGAFLAVGPVMFEQFLAGARRMDRHFRDSDWLHNLPALLAFISIWQVNFFNYGSHAIVPYDQRLARLPAYLCQLVMESNGKSRRQDGQAVDWQTAPVTWGGVGSNAQHSFFQALHQGSQVVPVDFLAPLAGDDSDTRQRDLLLSCLAQSRALMCGRQEPGQAQYDCPGNRPSNTLLYPRLSAEVLGMLLALYEHKTFVQAQLWQINPFDQWGVELGKSMTRQLAQQLETPASDTTLDASTWTLLERYRVRKQD